MSRRHELDTKLALYQDLGDILGAMRSFALTELRRISLREDAQSQTTSIMFNAFNDMAPFFPAPESIDAEIFVLIGSARGFCASYNEDVLEYWRAHKQASDLAIIVGERLMSLAPEAEQGVRFVPGAVNSNDIMPVIDQIISTYSDITNKSNKNLGMAIVLREMDGVISKRLWPIQPEPKEKHEDAPRTLEPPSSVAASLAQHCLFHMLISFLLRALHTENHMRLMQMENAMKHIDENGALLRARRNRIRQEEIVSEIELIMMERKSA